MLIFKKVFSCVTGDVSDPSITQKMFTSDQVCFVAASQLTGQIEGTVITRNVKAREECFSDDS